MSANPYSEESLAEHFGGFGRHVGSLVTSAPTAGLGRETKGEAITSRGLNEWVIASWRKSLFYSRFLFE